MQKQNKTKKQPKDMAFRKLEGIIVAFGFI